MPHSLSQLELKFNAMTMRERLLIAFSIFVVVAYGWWSYYAETNQQEITRLEAENSRLITESATLNQTLLALQTALKKGVKNKKKERLFALKKKLSEIEQDLKQKTVELIDPNEMFSVLSQLVYKSSHLKLLNLKRVSVSEAIPQDENAKQQNDQNAAVTVYRHTMQISLAGNFSDIVQYMAQLEQMDWKLIWDSLEVEQLEKSGLKLTLKLSTLSNQASWVGI